MSAVTLLLLGIGLTVLAQLAVAIYAFRASVLRGIMCLVVPLYVYVYANRAGTNPWFMRLWYLGIALFVIGGVVAS